MTTFYTILIALAVFIPGFPLSMWLAEKAGVPDYGCNPDQKPGWMMLYILALFPTALAFAWIALCAILFIVGETVEHLTP